MSTLINSLIHEYDLTANLLSSAAAVYIAVIIGYFAASYLLKFVLDKNNAPGKLMRFVFSYLTFVPFIFIGILLVFLFPGSEFVEYVFLLLYVILYLLIKTPQTAEIKKEYVLSARSIGIPQKDIYSKVILKSVQPALINAVRNCHLQLWTLVIAIEIFKEGLGIGSAVIAASDNYDIAAFIVIAVIVSLIVFVADAGIKFIHKKFVFWE